MATANLETAAAQLRQAEAALEKRSLRAPFDGVVTKRIRATGEAVDQYFPVMVMVNPERLWLEVFVPAARFGRGEGSARPWRSRRPTPHRGGRSPGRWISSRQTWTRRAARCA